MNKYTLLFVATVIVSASCQPALTPVLLTTAPSPVAIYPTITSALPTPVPPTEIPAPVPVTVTFAGGTCIMDGPKTVPADTTLSIDWILADKYDFPGLCIVTLDKSKTIDDLKAATDSGQPSWVHLYYCFENPGDRATEKAELKTGPVYFACFSSRTKKIGALGPIEIR